MIIPMVCFTCGRPIAHLWEKYSELLKNYEIKIQTKKNLKPDELNKTPEYLALRDLQIGTMCCRRMFICQHDMYDKIR